MASAHIEEGPSLELRTESLGAARLRVSARGEIDLSNADQVTAALVAAETTRASVIFLDLSGVTFIDSTGLKMLLQADARSRQDSNRLRILASPAVTRLIQLCAVEERLPLAPPSSVPDHPGVSSPDSSSSQAEHDQTTFTVTLPLDRYPNHCQMANLRELGRVVAPGIGRIRVEGVAAADMNAARRLIAGALRANPNNFEAEPT